MYVYGITDTCIYMYVNNNTYTVYIIYKCIYIYIDTHIYVILAYLCNCTCTTLLPLVVVYLLYINNV